MASASSLLSEEQFLCAICLDVFTEPVTTACGHNYCQACITWYWTSSGLSQCPMCKEKFLGRPQLQVNREFREVVEHFKNTRVRGRDESPAKQGEVPCDVCDMTKMKAQKSCLVCLASFCHTHLEPHQRVAALKRHKLIDPVENFEDRVCKKHNKMLELFCRSDQMCICVICLKDHHATHETVHLEEEFQETKAQLEAMMSEIKVMEQAKSKRVLDIKYSAEQSREAAEKEMVDIVEIFTALAASLQRNQCQLIEVIEEKQRAVEKQAKDHIGILEREIGEHQKVSAKLEWLSHTEDHLRLLQSLPSLSLPPQTENRLPQSPVSAPLPAECCSNVSDISVGKARRALLLLEDTLCKEMERVMREVKVCHCAADKEAGTATEQEKKLCEEKKKKKKSPPQDKPVMIQRRDDVDVNLDPVMEKSKAATKNKGSASCVGCADTLCHASFLSRYKHVGRRTTDKNIAQMMYYQDQVAQMMYYQGQGQRRGGGHGDNQGGKLQGSWRGRGRGTDFQIEKTCQNTPCFRCRQIGHWSRDCPWKKDKNWVPPPPPPPPPLPPPPPPLPPPHGVTVSHPRGQQHARY